MIFEGGEPSARGEECSSSDDVPEEDDSYPPRTIDARFPAAISDEVGLDFSAFELGPSDGAGGAVVAGGGWRGELT